MTCGTCRRAQKDGFFNEQCEGIEFVDECKRHVDQVPKLLDENQGFVDLLPRVLPGLINNMGGFDYRAIDIALDRYGVPEGQQPVIMDRFIVIINVIKEIREKSRK